MDFSDCLEKRKIRKLISVSSEYINELKKQIKLQLDAKLKLWDNEYKGIMIGYEDLKVLKKNIEVIDEQDYLNVPVSFKANYFFPKQYENAYANITKVNQTSIFIRVLGFMEGLIEFHRNLNNHVKLIEKMQDGDESTVEAIDINSFIKKNISLREKFNKKNILLKPGMKIKVKILNFYVQLNNEVVCVCDLDNHDFEISN